jgi:8-oxo-dGTP pyrophosphatase MutT (NUDIX family)
MQTIYFGDKKIVLTTNAADCLPCNTVKSNFAVFYGASVRHYKQAIQILDTTAIEQCIIADADEKKLEEVLYESFEPVDAGGGAVINEDGALLMIFRKGKWDLPKGKLDAGEKMEDCAVREVQEETGLKQVVLGEKIMNTYHIYLQRKSYMIKRTTWYYMTGTKADPLVPQAEEQIQEVRWVAQQDIQHYAIVCFAAVRDVLKNMNWV